MNAKNSISECPLNAAWIAVGGKWKLTIIYWLAARSYHFAALKRQIDAVSAGISQKVLTQQLRELVADGIVQRESTGSIPSPVIYSLTAYGASTLPMVDAAQRWGVRHLARTKGTGTGVSCASGVARIAS